MAVAAVSGIFMNILEHRLDDVPKLIKVVENVVQKVKHPSYTKQLAEADKESRDRLIRLFAEAYSHSLRSARLAHVLEKILHCLPRSYMSGFIEEMKIVLQQLLESNSLADLRTLSALLDQKLVTKLISKEHFGALSNHLKNVLEIASCFTHKTTHCEDEEYRSCSVKLCIQVLHLFPQEIRTVFVAPHENHSPEVISTGDGGLTYQQSWERIIINLLTTLLQSSSQNTVILIGTAIVMIFSCAPSQDVTQTACHSLLSAVSQREETCVKFAGMHFNVAELMSKIPGDVSVSVVAIIKGILVTCSPDTLTTGQRPLLIHVFPYITQLCQGPNLHHYLAFQLLALWFRKLENTESICSSFASVAFHAGNPSVSSLPCQQELFRISTVPCKNIFVENSGDQPSWSFMSRGCQILNSTLVSIWVNWESPVEGVSELVVEIFGRLLRVWQQAVKKRISSYSDLCEHVLADVLSLGWHCKARYRSLSVLLTFVDGVKVIQTYGQLRDDLMRCMKVNQMASVACDVYKAFIQQIVSSYEETRALEIWSDIWMPSLLSGLTSSDSLQSLKTRTYWLPPTLKLITGSSQVLRDTIDQHLSLAEGHSRQCWLYAWVSVSAAVREILSVSSLCLASPFLKESLLCAEDDIRTEALRYLCSSLKKGEPMSSVEASLLQEFIPANLKTDSTAFRQNMASAIKKMMVRIRDSCLSSVRNKRTQEYFLALSIQFVDWLYKVLMFNLVPGACYQRRQTSLDLLVVMLETLVYQRETTARKGRAQESSDILLLYAQSLGLWKFFNKEHFKTIVYCLVDSVPEIQTQCYSLLVKYFTWPEITSRSSVSENYHNNDYTFLPPSCAQLSDTSSEIVSFLATDQTCAELYRQGLYLASSPRAYEAHSGMLMMSLLMRRCIMDHDMNMSCSYYDLPETCQNVGQRETVQNVSRPEIHQNADQHETCQNVGQHETCQNVSQHETCQNVGQHETCQNVGQHETFQNVDQHPSPVVLSCSDQNIAQNKVGRASANALLELLISKMKMSLDAVVKNLGASFQEHSLHGLTQVVARCMLDTASSVKGIEGEEGWRNKLQEIIALNQKIISFVLDVLSGRQNFESCPSFADMGVALTSLISDSQEQDDEVLSLSPQFQLLLSWCWHNLWESCTSLGEMCGLLVVVGTSSHTLPLSVLSDTAQTFVKLLTTCRHRGAIEGSRCGLQRFCVSLLSSGVAELTNIPKTILQQILSNLSQNSLASSVTRRSAGLPIFVQTIIQADHRSGNTDLLMSTVEVLHAIASQPVASDHSQHQDLSQSHALNILKAIVCDASLAPQLLPVLSKLTILVVEGFDSASWAIRNAATQLISTLVTRIYGQKNQGGAGRSMSLEEFSVLYPELLQFVCEKMKIYVSSKAMIKPSLYIVLTLLSELGMSPSHQHSSSWREFLTESLLFFMSSPVFSLRKLSAQAYVALSPIDTADTTLRLILQKIGQRGLKLNALHGWLLSGTCLMRSGTVSQEMCRELLKFAVENKWLLTQFPACLLPVSALLHIIQLSVAQLEPDVSLHGELWEIIEDLLGSLCTLEVVFQIDKDQCVKICAEILIGIGRVSGDAGEMFRPRLCQFLQDSLSSSCDHLREAVLDCLQTGADDIVTDPDIQKAIFASLAREKHMARFSRCTDLLMTLTLKSDLHLQLPDCLSLNLAVLKSQWGKIKSFEAPIFTLEAIFIGRFNSTESESSKYSTLLDWCERLLNNTKSTHSEDFRMCAAKSLVIAGPAILNFCRANKALPGVGKLLSSLTKASLQLLEDAEVEVRCLVSRFISHHQGLTSLSTGWCYPVLSRILCDEFSWSLDIVSTLLELLYTPGQLTAAVRSALSTGKQVLFEPETASVLSETFTTQIWAYSTLQDILAVSPENSPFWQLKTKVNTVTEELRFNIPAITDNLSEFPLFNISCDVGVVSSLLGMILLCSLSMVCSRGSSLDELMKEDSKHLQDQEDSKHLQDQEDSKHLQDQEDSKHLQDQEDSKHLQDQEDSKHLQDQEDSKHLQDQEDSKHLQDQEDSNHIQNQEDGKHLQDQEDGKHLQDKEDGKHLQDQEDGKHLQDQEDGKHLQDLLWSVIQIQALHPFFRSDGNEILPASVSYLIHKKQYQILTDGEHQFLSNIKS